MTLPVPATAVGPDYSAVDEIPEIEQIIGTLLTGGLLLAVLMLIVCSIGWALGSASGNWQTATRSRNGLLVAVLGTVLLGASLGWANWLLDLGPTL